MNAKSFNKRFVSAILILSTLCKDDVRTNLNRSYELARPIAQALGLTIIHGAEITRPIPPRHLNAIFLQDANALAVKGSANMKIQK